MQYKLYLTEGGDVQCSVALLCSCVHISSSLEQLLHHVHVAFLAGQVQRVKPILADRDTVTGGGYS